MKKYLLLQVFLLVCLITKATTYYSRIGGTANFNSSVWSTSAAGPFNISGTLILATDDVIVQATVLTLNRAAASTYCRHMTVRTGGSVVTINAVIFTGDLTIENGGIFLLGPAGSNAGSVTALNLYVNSGGKIWGNDPVNSGATNLKTIRINGSQVVCNGIIGNGINNDALLIQPEGATVTISGNGAVDCARIRKGAGTVNITNLIIDADVNVRLGTTCVYNNQNNTTFNVTVNAGKTLRCIAITNPTGFAGTEGSISLNGTLGINTSRRGLYTINGTLECENLYLAAVSVTPTDVFKYLVGTTGTIVVNNQVKGNSTAASTSATAALELQSGAKLALLGLQPTSNVDGTGTKNTFLFHPESIVEYGGTDQVIEHNFGKYGKLVISGAGLKTLSANTSIGNLIFQ